MTTWVCPRCGEKRKGYQAAFCGSCVCKVLEERQPLAGYYCKLCGHESRESFSGGCELCGGWMMDLIPPSILCSQCGEYIYRVDDGFHCFACDRTVRP